LGSCIENKKNNPSLERISAGEGEYGRAKKKVNATIKHHDKRKQGWRKAFREGMARNQARKRGACG